MKTLVVIHPFGGHEKGAEIDDPSRVAEILDGEHAHHVVAVEREVRGKQVAPNEWKAEAPETATEE